MEKEAIFLNQLTQLIDNYGITESMERPINKVPSLIVDLETAIREYRMQNPSADIESILESKDKFFQKMIKYQQSEDNRNNNKIETIINYISRAESHILKRGETSADHRITRLNNKEEIYIENTTKNIYAVYRYKDKCNIEKILIVERIAQTKEIKYYTIRNNREISEDDFLYSITFEKGLDPSIENMERIFDSSDLIEAIIRNPILNEGELTFNGRLLRKKIDEREYYIDRLTKEALEVYRYSENAIRIIRYYTPYKYLERYFINGVEIDDETFASEIRIPDKEKPVDIIPIFHQREEYSFKPGCVDDPWVLKEIIKKPILKKGETYYNKLFYRTTDPEETYRHSYIKDTHRNIVVIRKDEYINSKLENLVRIIHEDGSIDEYCNSKPYKQFVKK